MSSKAHISLMRAFLTVNIAQLIVIMCHKIMFVSLCSKIIERYFSYVYLCDTVCLNNVGHQSYSESQQETELR